MAIRFDAGEVITAMVTPFDKNREIDYNKVEDLTKYLIDNEKNGFIFPSGNADELAKKLENFIKNFDQLYEKMGKAAREAYLKNNTISLLMKNLELAAQNLKKTTLPTPQKTKSKSDYEIIAQSKYFDKDYYLKTYPEVAKAKIDPIKHYLEIGWKEFKNPSEKFNTKNYLYTYQDVLRANRNPLLHWEKNGKHELREAELKCIKNGKYYENLPFWKYKEELELWYKSRAKKEIDLNNPQTYNEKLQWLKLYDARPEKTMLADKYEVREWIKKKIGEEYLIPLIGVYEKFDDIDIEKLPKKFVMKCTHGSGWNIIVKDKEEFNIAEAREKMERWLNSNFAYSCGFELQYKNMKPRIIIEEYMDDGSGDLRDYKFTCFNGKVDFIWVDSDRHTKHRRTLYSTKWEKLPYKMGTQYEADEPVEKPKELSKMLSFAARLSKGFAYARVDFYVINNKVYFGELTFTSTSGIDVAEPKSFERHLFQALKLPRKAYDLSRQQYCRVSEAYPQPHIDVTAIQNQPEQKSKSDLTLSIVIPIYNALSDVKKCLFSLNRAHLLPSTEIFLIDDCSDTQTQNYLLSFVNKFKKFQYVRNPVNSGFIISSNKGIDLAHNDIVVILNSDTKVPRGFDALISACFIAHPRVAVASPLSTHSGLFSIPERPHSKLDSIQKLLNDNVKPTYPLITPEGFCLCLNKRIINKIGKLDEIYGFGYSEEDDLILRALSKGYKTVLIDNLIVYHKSHASFTSERRLKILEKNRRIFRQRWGNLQAETRQAMNMMNIVKTINDNVNRLIDNKENHVRFKSKKSR